MPKGSLKDFTTRVTGGGRSGKKSGVVEKLNRNRAIRAQGEIPLREFGNISAGLPKRGRVNKSPRGTIPQMGARLKGKKP